MTIEERINRLEHFTAGLDDQARRDREESRQLWRETQRELLSVSRKLNDLADKSLRSKEEADERDRKADERIQALVSAMGEWIRKDKP
jgi:hypothetical protein